MRCTISRPHVIDHLDPAQRYTVALALGDAIAHRTPQGQCPDCAEDMDCVNAYRDLARHFGVAK